jgi:hypothetical protein
MPHNPNCPACREKRFHTPEEWRLHAGEGRQGKSESIPIKENHETDNREHHEDRTPERS